MKLRFITLSLLLGCIFIFTNCHRNLSKNKTAKDTLKTLENSVLSTFEQAYNKANIPFTHLQAKAKLDYQGEKDKVEANLVIRSRYDSVLWVSVIPLLGIEAARIKVNKDSIYVLDKINHKATLSSIKKAEEVIGVPVSLKDIQEVLFGQVGLRIQKNSVFKTHKDHYTLHTTEGNLSYAYEVDAQYHLKNLRLKQNNNQYSSHISYMDYKPVANQMLPFMTFVEAQAKEKIKAELTYTKINTEISKINTPMDIPRSYEIIRK